MNEMATTVQAPLVPNGPTWLTLSFVLIGLGILFALFILLWGTRLANRRRHTRDDLQDRGEVVEVPARTSPPPASSAPPQIADAAVVPRTPVADAGPDPRADEPVAAAAPFDAAPAALASSEPAPTAGGDTLTRMKGVGPRLAEQLNAAGIVSFAQLAALSPEEAEALDTRMGNFQGRIHRDRWIEQARFLAAGDTAGYEAVFGKL